MQESNPGNYRRRKIKFSEREVLTMNQPLYRNIALLKNNAPHFSDFSKFSMFCKDNHYVDYNDGNKNHNHHFI